MKDSGSFSRNRDGVCFQFIKEVSVKRWKRLTLQLFGGVIALAITAPCWAQKHLPGGDPGNNNLPPAGAILDLAGTPIPGGGNSTYQHGIQSIARSAAIRLEQSSNSKGSGLEAD